jgi:gamma-glutamyl:cysteine ligase YbdK (ATP-grasp superfamily)
MSGNGESQRPLHLFAGYGIEVEYMIVDRETLDVRPLADRVLEAQAGEIVEEVEVGALSWSNELPLHQIELKTNGPAPRLAGLAGHFQDHLGRIDSLLEPHGARLMPTGMHPWMDPHSETRLWPHGNSAVYQAYDRIFGCQGHGWSNLQSVHLNLPFAGDAEFGRLHAAVRLILPLLPALAASTPVIDGAVSGLLDTRIEVYRQNQRRIPSIAGKVIPEPIFSREVYEREILQRLYDDIAVHDPQNRLRFEWLNSRGAIARFDRSAIEIRLIDTQECPAADLGLVGIVVAGLQALVGGRWSDFEAQAGADTEALAATLALCVARGDDAVISHRPYLELLGINEASVPAGEIWRHLAEAGASEGWAVGEASAAAGRVLLEEGPLARRLLRSLGRAPSRRRLREVYRDLCDCLAEGRVFRAR